jgi:hypothetical protein
MLEKLRGLMSFAQNKTDFDSVDYLIKVRLCADDARTPVVGARTGDQSIHGV